ncbi:hybrid sensor histidine kinase/response regulator transcription factor [Echinicola shivajiensis]|uniref:hybrid sensor histidine kinase/response regulator transcription factor n=1 Tax=Echinicola shivajiensis TaxID=1035916 RepID=UPI001BFBF844|nr:two-component regulator propeller domain-containing protein [Echinicola shivajiensis]
MKRILLTLCIFVGLLVELFAGVKPVFHKLTTQDGLSHSTVYSMVQDHKGYIWIGTREGLNRYNSYDLKTYYSEEKGGKGLSADEVLCVEAVNGERLFIGTSIGLDRYDYNTDRIENIHYGGKPLGYIKYLFESSDSLLYVCSTDGLFLVNQKNEVSKLRQEVILAIAEYKKDVFWLMTVEGVYLVNKQGETIKEYPDFRPNRLTRNNFYSMFKDSQGTMWLGAKEGVFRYSPKRDAFEKISASSAVQDISLVRAISEDDQNRLWLGTENGLYIYDQKHGDFEHYSQSFDQSPYALSDQSVYCIYKSRESIMWMGTYFGGVNFVKLNDTGFVKLVADGGKSALGGKAVSQIMEDRKGNLWIGSEDVGVTVWDSKRENFSYLKHKKGKVSISGNNVHAIEEDDAGNIWIGTFLEGINRYDPSTGNFKVYKHRPRKPGSISHNNVFSLMKDSKGKIWAGTWGGINIYDKESDSFHLFKPHQIGQKFIYDMIEDDQGIFWICTRNHGIYRYDSNRDSLTWFNKDLPNNHGLTANKVISAFQDSKERIWFGTLNGGLLRWDDAEQKFITYTKDDGLPNNNVYGILEDRSGALWMSTNKGLTVLRPETGEFVTYDKSKGLQDVQFNFKSSYQDKEGRMYFGTVNGLYHFHPDSIRAVNIPPSVHFTEMKLFNKPLQVGGSERILEAQIDETEYIQLNYSQNVITFDFVATNYFSPGKNAYSYYLEGFEKTWNKPAEQNSATYTNLSPGDYVFHVKAANPNGVWSGERKIRLTVTPPFWLTIWAKLFYLLLVIAVIYGYKIYLSRRSKEKVAYQLEKVEKDKMRELHQHKLNFFTYISHEFKTPLTLIIAAIDKFLENSQKDSIENQDFKLIKRNAGRLHFLIEQLMDFRKTESDHTCLKPRQGDIVLFLKDTFNAFIPLYNKKNISFNFQADREKKEILFDADKVEKIITNLVSNAIKNTPEFGEINMSVSMVSSKDKEDSIQIQLEDNGRGLSKEDRDKIFLPFYQAEHNKPNSSGSGIGLALVGSLAKYLGGSIEAEIMEEEGTRFTILLPINIKTNEEENYKKVIGNKSLLIDEDLYEINENEEVDQSVEKEDQVIFDMMIVEDNEEMRKFLVDYFSKYYKIISAKDGLSALGKIKKNVPDVIISDVVMPQMGGVELCEVIKSNIDTSHIPFILLTAKSTFENKMEGLGIGADAYLPKPFNLQELRLIVKNTLESRNSLKQHFLKFGSIDNYEKPVNNKDHEFLKKLIEIVHLNLEDPSFNITSFSKEAGVSRTLLHMKLKKLVNLSATEFVKAIRLKRSTILLLEDKNVSEVAYAVGFSDPNYFSRTFKEKYGVPPSGYKEGYKPIDNNLSDFHAFVQN